MRPSMAGLLLLGALLATPSALAASYDPQLTWRVLTTEHYRIHFHQGLEALAEDLSLMVDEIHEELVDDMRWRPRRRIELILVDRTDIANGYAATLPRNTIVMFATAPQEDSTLGLYEDWLELLFTHELTHILHLDANHGLARLGRLTIGRIASTNRLSPPWMIEGLATHQETRHTTGGRGRSTTVDMIKRAAVVEDAFPPLGNLDGLQADPPGGNLRYLFGQDFISYVAEQQGEHVWNRWVHAYGGGIPYVLPSRRAFGRRLLPLYRDWREDAFARYGAQADAIRAEGLLEGRLISDAVASCTAPAFSPDGEKLVWSCHDRRTGSAIWMADGQGEGAEVLLERRGARSFTWRRDSKAFAYAATRVVNRFNTFSDVYLHVLGSERATALTSGARARDPEFSPDGSRLVVVTNRAQENQLQQMRVDRILEPLTEFEQREQISRPRFSPCGSVMALTMWQHGRRDLWLFSPGGEPLRRLTADAWLVRDPTWSPDGRWLYFSYDRSGVPNIYAIEVETERLFQVTNVLTGATAPSLSADGRLLAYQQYSKDGWEVRLLSLDRDAFLDRGLLPRPVDHHAPLAELLRPGEAPVALHPTADDWQGDPPGRRLAGVPFDPWVAQSPDETLDTFDQAEAVDVFGEEEDFPFTFPTSRYNPLRTLAPTFWLPYLQSSPYEPRRFGELGQSGVLTLATAGNDTLRHLGYNAHLTYRNDADALGGGASLILNRWLPVYSLGGRTLAVPYGEIGRVGADGEPVGTGERYWERRSLAQVGVSWPYTHRTSVFARYTLTHRTPLRDLPDDAWLGNIPVRGTLGAVSGGWRYAWAQPTPYAISVEDGRVFSLVGALYHPLLGSRVRGADDQVRGFEQAQLTAELREYRVTPWLPNHVVAIRAAGGLTYGSTDFLGSYLLGGSWGDSAYYATPEEFRMLRGYPMGSRVGDAYWLTSLEYRAPLWRIDRGVGTVPAFARALSGAVFVDAGNAFTGRVPASEVLGGALVGVGAELRLSTYLGWSTPFTGRLGWATGLMPGGHGPLDAEAFYFQVGSSF